MMYIYIYVIYLNLYMYICTNIYLYIHNIQTTIKTYGLFHRFVSAMPGGQDCDAAARRRFVVASPGGWAVVSVFFFMDVVRYMIICVYIYISIYIPIQFQEGAKELGVSMFPFDSLLNGEPFGATNRVSQPCIRYILWKDSTEWNDLIMRCVGN